MRVPRRVICPGVTAPIVAIDGPAGAGKSTVARELARRLGFTIVDTGAIYRAVALAALRGGIGWEEDAGLSRLLDAGLGISFVPAGDGQRVLLHGEDVTEAIRTPEISRGAVLEGRDIGTVVFPDADVKFFLTASDEARAARRHAELADRGLSVPLREVLADQRRRDKDDSERAIAPLKPAADAVVEHLPQG